MIRNTTKALTLTELLVSTAMLGVVIIGVVTVDLAIRQMQQVARRSGSVSMEVSAAIIHMVNSAQLAMGHRTNEGIAHRESAGNYEALFFRIDFNTPPTPSDYTDDTWVRYMVDFTVGAGGLQNMLVYCNGISANTITDPSVCDGVGATQITLLEIYDNRPTFPTDFDYENNLTNLDFYVEMTISALPDPTLALHNVTNKPYRLATRVSPLGHTY